MDQPRRRRVWTVRRCLIGLVAFGVGWAGVGQAVTLTGPKGMSWYGAVSGILLIWAWNFVGWDYEMEAHR